MGVVETLGNNVDARELVGGSVYRPNGGAACDFRFEDLDIPILNGAETQGDLEEFRNASITNLFFTCNVLHDVFYAYGFNEAAGNFQQENFGRGGLGGDRVLASRIVAQCNANNVFVPEGTAANLNMGYCGIYRSMLSTISASSEASGAVAIAGGDLNGEGGIDLVVANEDTNNVTVFLNTGNGQTFTSMNHSLAGGVGPKALAVAEIHGSNGPDIVVANGGSNTVTVLYNNGTGQSFTAVSYLGAAFLSSPTALAAADFDGDGDLDLAVANSTAFFVTFVRNDGGGTLQFATAISVGAGATGILALQLGGSTLPDVAVTTRGPDRLVVLQNQGSITFTTAASLSLPDDFEPSSLSGADFDGDGDEDLAVAQEGRHMVSVYQNTFPAFTEVKRVSTGDAPAWVVARETSADGSQPRPMNLNVLNQSGSCPGSPPLPCQPDIVTANAGSGSLSVRLNRHDQRPWYFGRHFLAGSSSATLTLYSDYWLSHSPLRGAVAADFNADGILDVAAAVDASPSSIAVLRGAGIAGAGGSGFFFDMSQTAFVRDNALDNSYITHEFSHGVTYRLTGGPSVPGLLATAHAVAMAEGWSDFFALVFTQPDGSVRGRGFAPFWIGEPSGGLGIRTNPPYSPDPLVSDLGFADLPTVDPSEHGRGQIWASVMWDIYWALTGRYGRSGDLYRGGFHPQAGGENIAMQLAIDACKLQGAEPSMIKARDAVLLADVVDYGGKNLDILWAEFASRGMGWSACDSASTCGDGQYDPNSLAVVKAKDVPPFGKVTGKVFEDLDCDGVRDLGEPAIALAVVFLDLNRNGVQDSGDQKTFTDSAGKYTLVNLYPEVDYDVGIFVPSGWRQTLPLPVYLEASTALQWDGSTDTPSQAVADVWGEGAFAYIGHTDNTGVDIVDLSILEEVYPDDPAASGFAALAARWTSPDGFNAFQDVKVKNQVGFFASEDGGGVSLVDISNPFAPRRLWQIKAAADPANQVVGGGRDQVHNVFVDGNYLYIAENRAPPFGQPLEVPVFDVSAVFNGGGAPAFLRDVEVRPVAGARRVHDVTVQAGRLYVCEVDDGDGGRGYVHVFDVSAISTSVCLLSTFEVGPQVAAVWPSADNSHLVVVRETQPPAGNVDNQLEVWDLSVLAGQPCPGGGAPLVPSCAAVVHMAPPAPSVCGGGSQVAIPGAASSPARLMVAGDLLYVAWYEAGVLVFDLSDPTQPQELGRFDTYPGAPAVAAGCSGVYPLLGPSRILASDRDGGLFVLSNRTTYTVRLSGSQTLFRDFGLSRTCN
jgi:hypothetical protein